MVSCRTRGATLWMGPAGASRPPPTSLPERIGDLMLSYVLLTVLGSAIAAQAGTDDLKVLTDADAANTMMTAYLNGQAQFAFDRRAAEIEKLTTPELIGERQQAMRAFFIEQLGGWPERAPLNARITGTLDADGYRVEKVVFESRPGLHVTATMYLPLSAPPYPAVLVPCGHSREAKAYENYQRLSILLARNGLAALCFDPIGQGERFQTLKPDGKPGIGGTLEHTHVGTSCMLVGINAASYFVWDGIRAIDYLVSRPDVDAGVLGLERGRDLVEGEAERGRRGDRDPGGCHPLHACRRETAQGLFRGDVRRLVLHHARAQGCR